MITGNLATTASPAVKTAQTTQSLTVAKATFASSAVAAKGASADDVVTISKSMENLLDKFTGVGKKKTDAAKPEAPGAPPSSAPANSAAPETAKETAKETGKGGFSSDALDRAREAESIMNRVANNKDAFAEGLGRALKGLQGAFGGAMEQLGASKDQIDNVLKDFSDDLLQKVKTTDFSELAVDYQSSSTQFSIETGGIDLIVQDGDRQLKISYAKSTLDLRREDESLQAQVGKDGESMVRVGQSSTTADGKAEGMLINAKGFSSDEVESILSRLNELSPSSGAGGSAGGGLAVLTPEKRADGTLKLKLDLSAILPPASETAAGAATAGAAKAGSSLNITA
jgi:hypothetical protein